MARALLPVVALLPTLFVSLGAQRSIPQGAAPFVRVDAPVVALTHLQLAVSYDSARLRKAAAGRVGVN